MRSRTAWALLLAGNALCYCMLSFYQTTTAATPTSEPPFINAVEQRAETITELREIKNLLKEQNELLRSGTLKVVVGLPEKKL